MDSPTDYSREEYAALPVKVARALRRKWGQSPEQRATTSRGYPYPLRSWPPDAAIDIQNLADAVNSDAAANFVPGPWQTMTLLNGWVRSTGGGNTYSTAQARLEQGGTIVRLRGLVVLSVNLSAANTHILTLPTAMRPPARHILNAYILQSTVNPNGNACRLSIVPASDATTPGGVVLGEGAIAGHVVNYVSLSGLAFDLAPIAT